MRNSRRKRRRSLTHPPAGPALGTLACGCGAYGARHAWPLLVFASVASATGLGFLAMYAKNECVKSFYRARTAVPTRRQRIVGGGGALAALGVGLLAARETWGSAALLAALALIILIARVVARSVG
jgi:hypothetical protein